MCIYVYLQLYPLMLHQRGGGGAHKASVLLMSSDKAAELWCAPRLLDLAVARSGWVDLSMTMSPISSRIIDTQTGILTTQCCQISFE